MSDAFFTTLLAVFFFTLGFVIGEACNEARYNSMQFKKPLEYRT